MSAELGEPVCLAISPANHVIRLTESLANRLSHRRDPG